MALRSSLPATVEDITAQHAAVLVSSSPDVTQTGLLIADQMQDNSIGVFLVGAEAISDMGLWVRADCAAQIHKRHGLDGIKDAADKTGIGIGTLQNAATTSYSWPYDLRRSERYQTYSHHQALNALSQSEKLVWLQRAAENEWSVSRLKHMVNVRADADDTNEIQQEWEVNQKRIDAWSAASGVEIERTDTKISLTHEGQQLTFTARVLPSGTRAAIELQEISNERA